MKKLVSHSVRMMLLVSISVGSLVTSDVYGMESWTHGAKRKLEASKSSASCSSRPMDAFNIFDEPELVGLLIDFLDFDELGLSEPKNFEEAVKLLGVKRVNRLLHNYCLRKDVISDIVTAAQVEEAEILSSDALLNRVFIKAVASHNLGVVHYILDNKALGSKILQDSVEFFFNIISMQGNRQFATGSELLHLSKAFNEEGIIVDVRLGRWKVELIEKLLLCDQVLNFFTSPDYDYYFCSLFLIALKFNSVDVAIKLFLIAKENNLLLQWKKNLRGANKCSMFSHMNPIVRRLGRDADYVEMVAFIKDILGLA